MKPDVSSDEVERYQRDGFIMFENFLDPEELEKWRQALEEAFAIRAEAVLPGGRWSRKADDHIEKIFVQRLNLWMDCPSMRELLMDGQLGKLAATLAGVEELRIWHDQALVKPPWGRPTDWHMDNPYWSFFSQDAISVWIALDDVTPDNGCLYFVPGSHRSEVRDIPDIGQGMDSLFRQYPEWAEHKAVGVPMKAGSASFHNGRTFHAAQANMTPIPRRAMTCAYMPGGSTFNGHQNVLPDEYFKTLQPGDTIDDDQYVPMVYPVPSSIPPIQR